MPDWTCTIDTPSELMLTLLLVGHVFSDFLVRTSSVARLKDRQGSDLIPRGARTLLTHLLLVLPYWNPTVIGGVFLLCGLHTGLDAIKARLERKRATSLGLFFAHQSTHGLLILALWLVLTRWHLIGDTWLPWGAAWMPAAAKGLIVAAGLVFNGNGGTAIVRLLLEQFPEVVPREGEGYNMGRTIGVLERVLIFTLVLLDQWGALGLVLAAKSIARFKELSTQHFADYYLIGTLASILVAIATGVLVRLVVLG